MAPPQTDHLAASRTGPTPDTLSPVLEATVQRFARMVRSIGRKHGLTDHDYDELFQDVRIRLWRAQEGAEPIGAVNTSYVYRTATSAAIDLIRQRRSQMARSVDDADPTATPDPGASALEALETTEMVEALARALERLPRSRRIVVELHLKGYDRQEIAELTGQTTTQVRNLVFRGLSDLRLELAEAGLRAGGTG